MRIRGEMARSAPNTSILVLSIVLHLLVYVAWPKGGDPVATPAERNAVAIFFIDPLPQRLEPSKPSRALSVGPSRRSDSRPSARQAESVNPAPMTLIAPESPGPAPSADLAGIAKSSVGAIDRELRQAGPALPLKAPVFQSSKFEQAMSAAYIDRSPPKQEELVLDDGRRVTRIGDHCYVMDSPLNTRGRDQIQKGSPVMARKCWQVGLAK
jgi:hypothetical protein